MSKDNEFDQRILEILRVDSRKSFVDIGKELGLSESAIRRRIKNLIDNGTISRFTIEENSSKKTSAITLLSVAQQLTQIQLLLNCKTSMVLRLFMK